MAEASKKKLALVLSGGGARGAYEAGIIHYIRTRLPPSISRRINFDILCGSSVGAINICFLGATAHNLEYQGQKAFELWNDLKQENIYRRGVGPLTKFVGRTLSGVIRNFLRIRSQDGNDIAPKKVFFRGLLDTAPLPYFLRKAIPWKQIALNIQNGPLKAMSITTTNVHTGKMELFIDKRPEIHYSGRHAAHFETLDVIHAMASAAIPIFFPAICIRGNYYCDGGLRLNTPLSPAIQLGADRILVVGLHHKSERAEYKMEEAFDVCNIPPTMGEMIGQVLKTIFVDRLDYDLVQLNRINQIIGWAEEVYGPEFLDRVNAHLATKPDRTDVAARGLKRLEISAIFPSVDIRKVFAECVETGSLMRKGLTYFERILLGTLDVDFNRGLDFLTFLLFMPPYLKKLLELGFEDAKAHHDKLAAFFEQSL